VLYPPELRGRNLIGDYFCRTPGNLLSSFVNAGQTGIHEIIYHKNGNFTPPDHRLLCIRLRDYSKPLGAIGPPKNQGRAELYGAGID
jgi:hypothetical protein